MSYTPSFLTIVDALDHLMMHFSHTQNDIGYGYRWTFDNGQRFDIIDYGKKGKNILRFWRGARLVRQYPVLHGRFDEVAKVIAKIEIVDVDTLEQKHVLSVLQLLHDAPVGVKVFD